MGIDKLKVVLLSLSLFSLFASAGEFPDDSIYQLNSEWQTQNAETVSISDFSGKTQIMAFVYTYCEHTCPLILAKLISIEEELPADLIDEAHFTLISLDPIRDTPEVLKAYMLKHKLDENRWTMLHADPDTVQELAAILGTRYRPMGQDDIAHSNTLTVVDPSGMVVHQSKGISEPMDELIKVLRAYSS
ncbi:MAG: SCO family protein [Granulosicoccaceae bacterium]